MFKMGIVAVALIGLVSTDVRAGTAGEVILEGFPVLRQPDPISCGPTCAAMVLRYYGVEEVGDLMRPSDLRVRLERLSRPGWRRPWRVAGSGRPWAGGAWKTSWSGSTRAGLPSSWCGSIRCCGTTSSWSAIGAAPPSSGWPTRMARRTGSRGRSWAGPGPTTATSGGTGMGAGRATRVPASRPEDRARRVGAAGESPGRSAPCSTTWGFTPT